MDIDIAVPAGLNLFRSHEKLLVQLLVQLIENQASLCGNQRRIGIGVLLIPDIHDGLAFLVNIIQHADKVLFVIAVIPIAFRYDGLYLLQCALHDIMHDRNGNFAALQLIHLFNHIAAYFSFLFIRKFGKGTVSALSYRIDNLLHIKGFSCPVLLDYLHVQPGLIFTAVILTLIFFHSLYHRFHILTLLPAAFPQTKIQRLKISTSLLSCPCPCGT